MWPSCLISAKSADYHAAPDSVVSYLSGYVESYLEGLNMASITSLHSILSPHVPFRLEVQAETGLKSHESRGIACHVHEGPHKLIVCPPQAFWAICTKSDF